MRENEPFCTLLDRGAGLNSRDGHGGVRVVPTVSRPQDDYRWPLQPPRAPVNVERCFFVRDAFIAVVVLSLHLLSFCLIVAGFLTYLSVGVVW